MSQQVASQFTPVGRRPASLDERGITGCAVTTYAIYSSKFAWIAWVSGWLIFSVGLIRAQTNRPDSANADYSSELVRYPPLTPEEALQSFEVIDGYRLDLVAAEPLVVDPIAFAFDARGRLFVVEMRGYSEQSSEHLGRIALLEDTDLDGRMDHRETFVENLSWPTAIWPWRDGVLVAEPPRITWYRDRNRDGVSDWSEDWFTGFGRTNVQGMVNSLRWGVDGYVHGITSSTGAAVESAHAVPEQALELRRRDFALDPLNRTLTPTSGGSQHGLGFNRWGDKFVTSNSDHLQQVIDLDQWLAEHPSPVAFPPNRRTIAADGPQAAVFRSSPVEPWRIVRTRLRVRGVVPGPIEGGGRPAGYFTGATGTWIVDGGSGFGAEADDVALVCDVGSNLVHRKRLIDQGLFWLGQRIDSQTELLRSRDTWFRPVQLGDGPDGAVYIADMYREVIEHPKSLPPAIKQHLDLTSGRDRGRIWRLARTDSAPGIGGPVNLGAAGPLELIDMLSNPVRWRRSMAAQLLVEKGVAGHEAALTQVLFDRSHPEASILAMHVAHRLNVLRVEHLRQLVTAEHPRVVEHALRLIRDREWGGKFDEALRQVVKRTEARIRLELALLAADLPPRQTRSLIAAMMSQPQDPMVKAAVVAAVGDQSWHALQTAGPRMDSERFGIWLRLMLPTWIPDLSQDERLQAWIAEELSDRASPRRSIWLDGICSLESQRDVTAVLSILPQVERDNLHGYIDRAIADSPSDVRFVRWLRCSTPMAQSAWFRRYVTAKSPNHVQAAGLELLDDCRHPELATLLLSALGSLTPELQQECLRILVRRPSTAGQLLDAIEQGAIQPGPIGVELRRRLEASSDSRISARSKQVFGQATVDRASVVERYAAALDQPGVDISRGRAVFEKSCAACHRYTARSPTGTPAARETLGQDVGAPLKDLANKSARQLLVAILDPNREVDPKYTSYSIVLDDDRILAGIIRDESATDLRLIEAGGRKHRIRRTSILQIKNSGVSLMPVGFEDQLTPTQLADLIAFLMNEQSN